MQIGDHAKRILIVEDDNLQQVILERMVTRMGHMVKAKVSDGASAIKSALKPDSIDLILMDIRLEDDIDGIEAMSRIRKSSDVKVVYVTASSEETNLKRAQKTGYVDFIRKPVSRDRLSEAFEKAFGTS